MKKKVQTLKEIMVVLEGLKPTLEEKYKVKEIGVFGSWVRGEQKKRSDIDILIEFYEKPDLFTYIEIEDFLSKKLKVKVDLVLKCALKPYIGKRILEEVKYI